MMTAAMEAVSGTDIKVFGVTALTSLSDIDTKEIFRRNTKTIVEYIYMTDVFNQLQMFITINRIRSLMTATSLNQCSDTSRVTKRKQDN